MYIWQVYTGIVVSIAKLKKYDFSLINVKKARKLLQQIEPQNQSHDNSLATSYHNLAIFYWNTYIEAEYESNSKAKNWLQTQGNYKKFAWQYAQKAIELKRGVLDQNHPEYQQTQKLIESMTKESWNKV